MFCSLTLITLYKLRLTYKVAINKINTLSGSSKCARDAFQEEARTHSFYILRYPLEQYLSILHSSSKVHSSSRRTSQVDPEPAPATDLYRAERKTGAAPGSSAESGRVASRDPEPEVEGPGHPPEQVREVVAGEEPGP